MPFIPQEDRKKSDTELATGTPGEKCYLAYRTMIREWRKNPCWTTNDAIASVLFPDPNQRAVALAYFVFFCLHVFPYELDKKRENGEVR